MNTIVRKLILPVFRKSALTLALLSASALAGCATYRPPEISYDDSVPPLPTVERPATDERSRPLHSPPAWTVARGGSDASTPTGQVENANAAARIEPRREGYYNAIQIYPWSEGALYQVYAAPGQITDIALEPGEALTGAGPIAALIAGFFASRPRMQRRRCGSGCWRRMMFDTRLEPMKASTSMPPLSIIGPMVSGPSP